MSANWPSSDHDQHAPSGMGRRALAWCVHAYTALGLVAAAGMAVLIVRGGDAAFRMTFALMVAATLVDATDGLLARAARVKEVLPGFDGSQLDNLVDFLTYVFLPLLLVWRAGILPAGSEAWLLVPLLAGAYWFCQVEAKTEDGYFLGFPAYWNFVAFYLYALDRYVVPLAGWFSIGLMMLLSVPTFIPTRYLYPSQPGRLNFLTNLLAVPWAVLLLWVLYRLPTGEEDAFVRHDPWLRAGILVSLLFPLHYMLASWLVSWRRWRAG